MNSIIGTGPLRKRAAVAAVALLAAMTLLATPAPAAAQQTGGSLYLVELIVFRTTSVNGNEDWSALPTGRGFGNESTRGGTPQVVRLLPPADYRLAPVEATLRSSGAWRPIAHAAWLQSAANWGTHIGMALSDLGINSPGLSGTVYLERATYLHLEPQCGRHRLHDQGNAQRQIQRAPVLRPSGLWRHRPGVPGVNR